MELVHACTKTLSVAVNTSTFGIIIYPTIPISKSTVTTTDNRQGYQSKQSLGIAGLGAALVTAALFQGLLTAVRTWLLIDTTDRMDLLLGSQVIDKLLRLPLRFFEMRPVGELSQRLSELGNLRGFLTGTAITSALDLLFATIYILIMLMYSPLLTAVALGTVPLYVMIILFIAPIYRRLIRNQAEFSARTQSHLIETLGGIQTVKAQHFELNSRWRWQERYSGQIAEGFKSVVLGSSR